MPRKKDKLMPYAIEDGVTQSLLTTFLACRRRCQYVLEGWESISPRDPLIFGSFFHGLMEHLYNHASHGEAAPRFVDYETTWHKECGHLIHDPQKFEAFMAMGEALYEEYIEYWEDDFERDFFEVEGVFDVVFATFRLRGRRDGVFNVKPKGKKNKRRSPRPWLLETKTASGIDASTLDLRLNFDFQNLFYITAFEIETGEKLAGVLYNVVVKPQIKVGTKANPDIQSYAASVKEAIKSDPEKYFHRFEVVYSEATKKRFREDLEIILWEFYEWVTGKGRTFHNPEACVTRWSCEFLSACASGGNMAGYTQTRKMFRELD